MRTELQKQLVKTVPIVGLDYVADGVREFCFEICKREGARFTAHMHGTFRNGAIVRFASTLAMLPRKAAFERLARKYMNRSIPLQIS